MLIDLGKAKRETRGCNNNVCATDGTTNREIRAWYKSDFSDFVCQDSAPLPPSPYTVPVC